MEIKRDYTHKDVEMLLGSQTVVDNLIAHIAELSVERTNLTIDYANALNVKIENVIEEFLGLDPKKDLRKATKEIYELQAPALKDIAFFKTQIDTDFAKNKDRGSEILSTLGFNENLTKAKKKDQEALIQLLYSFKKNMNPPLKSEVTAKGMSVALIDRIISYAGALKNADVSQETAKGSTKGITESAIKEFNSIYAEISGICKIGAKFYLSNKIIKEKFTFSKIIAHMKAPKPVATAGDNPAANTNTNPA